MNHMCHLCGGLVDLIGLQPRDVRLCDCNVKMRARVSRIAELEAELSRLRKGEECHVARPGEGTYECDIEHPCPACRLRRAEAALATAEARIETLQVTRREEVRIERIAREKAEAENVRLELLNDLRIRKMEAVENGVEFCLEDPSGAVCLLAGSFAKYFDEHNPPNYLAIELHTADHQRRFEMIMRDKARGTTAHDMRERAEAALATAREDAVREAFIWLATCGNPTKDIGENMEIYLADLAEKAK